MADVVPLLSLAATCPKCTYHQVGPIWFNAPICKDLCCFLESGATPIWQQEDLYLEEGCLLPTHRLMACLMITSEGKFPVAADFCA